MKNKLNNGFQLPQSSVSRVGRKVLFTGDVDEDTYGDLVKILFEMENEDDDVNSQSSAEVALNSIANVLESESEEMTAKEREDSILAINKYKKGLLSQNTYDREPIHLYLNSFGGSGYDMLGLIDIIRNLKTPVYTYCFGKCMSAGLILFMVGDRRYISRNSTLMLHQLASGYIGKVQDMVENVDEMERMQNLVEDLIMLHTHIDEEYLQEVRYRKLDCYIDAEQSIELGIADEII